LSIDREKLKDIISTIAGKLKFRPAIVEKDYYLTIILNQIETQLSERIVFKGGTLLNKIHLNYHRLSEDLDFTFHGQTRTRSERSKAIMPVREKMPEFLKALGLASDKPEGEGFNNSTQYLFKLKYPSVFMEREESVKLEISLRQPPLDKPVHNVIKHFYQDPFTGEDLFARGKVLSLSLNEAIAEKLKAAITRKDVAIRDYYDLWYIAESEFDFYQANFTKLFRKKLSGDSYSGDYRKNFGLNADQLSLLRSQVDSHLMPVIRAGEKFDLEKVFEKFNQILSDEKFN